MPGPRLKCPNCDTEYAAERMGLPEIGPNQTLSAAVKCLVCGCGFDAVVSPKPGNSPNWFMRVVLRRPVIAPGHSVDVSERG